MHHVQVIMKEKYGESKVDMVFAMVQKIVENQDMVDTHMEKLI